MVVLTTPRLLLRSFRRDDLPHYAALNADLDVVRYLGGVPLSREVGDWPASTGVAGMPPKPQPRGSNTG